MLYKKIIRPLLFQLEPEKAHGLVISYLKRIQSVELWRSLIQRKYQFKDPRLHQTVCGLNFRNPLGLAAGFDKYAELIPFTSALGFGFTEIGTITAQEQAGNPQPRLFRLPQDQALINRMGFNNAGADQTARTLERGDRTLPLGINIGKSTATPLTEAVKDYLYSLKELYPFADYFAINVSCPNTSGLQKLQEKDKLKEILSAVQENNPQDKPFFVKIAPDLTLAQVDEVLSVIEETKVSGIILTNTTLGRDGLKTTINEQGGLSGLPVRDKSTQFIRHVYQKTEGKLPIIGVGGIFTAEDAYEKIKAGASLVQVYTGFIYEGSYLVKKINRGLIKLMENDGFKTLKEAVGSETKKHVSKEF